MSDVNSMSKVNFIGRGAHEISHTLKDSLEFFHGLLLRVLTEFDPSLALDFERLLSSVIRARESEDLASLSEVEELIDQINLQRGNQLATAFSCYFHLANMCEENYRVQQLHLREEELLSRGGGNELGKSYLKLKQEVGDDEARRRLDDLTFYSVLTAHPTEARRRAVNGKIRRISKLFAARKELTGLSLLENERKMLVEIDALYRTSPIAIKKPTPLDESDSVTSMVENTMYDALIITFRRLDDFMKLHAYSQHEVNEHVGYDRPVSTPFFKLGSWIGSDRDGNPNVLPLVTLQVADKFFKYIVRKLSSEAVNVGRNLTLENSTTPPNDELKALWNKLRNLNSDIASQIADISQKELHRACVMVIGKRLEATAKRNFDYGYHKSAELLQELVIVQKSLLDANAHRSAYGPLQALIWHVQVFGFHLASQEVRQHSAVHAVALDEIRKFGINSDSLSPRTVEVLDTFRTISIIQRRYGYEMCHRYIISFTQSKQHIEDVYELARISAATPEDIPRLDVIPLFETMEDLQNSVAILESALELPQVREQLENNDRNMEIMLGYSDSSKDVGPVAATFALHEAQAKIATWALSHDINLVQFHGRGGALGRGGGPAHRAVLAQPPHSVNGTFKVTEQGEAITARYGDDDIAIRHIETVAAATLMNSVPSVEQKNRKLTEKYTDLIEGLTEHSRASFHDLVQSVGFASWFAHVTPLEEVGLLPIGSRPAKRGLSVNSLEDLRAIPWVFAWSQARVNLAAWYGFGDACQKFVDSFENSGHGLKILRDAYQEWNLFSTLVDNIEMSLAKADERIASLYLSLSNRDDLSDKVLQEMQLTSKWILKINQADFPLSRKKVLGQAIQIRRPYIDALSMLQICALKKLRTEDDNLDDEYKADLMRLLLSTVSGVSAGLQNTG